jgi:hypothetical protein
MPASQNAPDNVVRIAPNGGVYKLDIGAWPTERWVAVITLAALALLIGNRAGFRGVNVLGVRASVS